MIDHRKAVRHLRRVDERMAGVIDRVGAFVPWDDSAGSHFAAVARAIVYQQLSGKAAATIHERMLHAVGGGERPLTPGAVLRTPHEVFRGAGLSEAKALGVRDLATRCADGSLPIEALDTMDDDAVVAALTTVRGVGPWTAQMVLMFRLQRPDVFPALDLGIKKGMQQAFQLRALPSEERMQALAEPWRPWRTVASWYLWRLVDLPEAPAKGRGATTGRRDAKGRGAAKASAAKRA